jgi:hypothetical protein
MSRTKAKGKRIRAALRTAFSWRENKSGHAAAAELGSATGFTSRPQRQSSAQLTQQAQETTPGQLACGSETDGSHWVTQHTKTSFLWHGLKLTWFSLNVSTYNIDTTLRHTQWESGRYKKH